MVVGLSVDIEENDPSFVAVRVEGRVDATSSPGLEQKIAPYLEKPSPKVLLDFARVDYLSSAGMRLLLSVSKKAKSSGGLVAICSLGEEVLEIIKMAGFERILAIYSTEKEAVNALT